MSMYQWTTADADAFIAFCSALGITDRTIPLRVWASESNLDPGAHNPGGASGIFQLEPDTARGLGYDVTSDPHLLGFCKLTVADQLAWAARYFAGGRGHFVNVAAFYLFDFLPAQLHLAGTPDAVVCGARDGDPYPSAYEDNPGFDREHKGWITPADLAAAANRQYGPRAQAIAALVAQRAGTEPELPAVDLGPSSGPTLPGA